ncbi:MAG: hypothetical protein ACN2B6_00665 [Rickettsiales bacterium]
MQRPKIEDELEREVQEYADKHCEGNFSFAVRKLLRDGLRRERDGERERSSDTGRR